MSLDLSSCLILLHKQPILEPLTLEQWQEFKGAVQQFQSIDEQKLFLKALQEFTGVADTTLQAYIFSSDCAEKILQEELKHLESLSAFKQKAQKLIPNIDNILHSRKAWFDLQKDIESGKNRVLTSSRLINALSYVSTLSYGQLHKQLTKEQPTRTCKTQSLQNTEHKHNFFKLGSKGPNTLVLQETKLSSEQKNPLLRLKTRITTLESNDNGIKSTPNGKDVRLFARIGNIDVFKYKTPDSKKGIIDSKVESQLLNIKNSAIQFKATLEQIEEQRLFQRHTSQNSVMGGTKCKDVFIAHGIRYVPQQKNPFNWAHLIAYAHGGKQHKENLIPSTSASNLNTLHLVELEITKQLVNKVTKEILISVTPKYHEGQSIPYELEYALEYEYTNQSNEKQTHREVFYLNPQSHEHLSTKEMKESIGVLRKKLF